MGPLKNHSTDGSITEAENRLGKNITADALEHAYVSGLTEIPDQIQADLQQFMQQLCQHLDSPIPLVQDVKNYVLHSGGKRIRPLLALLIARGFDYHQPQLITLACIIEYIHSATLLHDDILDGASLRRGLYTVNKKWGNTPAVLIGDYFYTRAFTLISSLQDTAITQYFATANSLIVDGELLQLMHVGNTRLSILDYFRIIWRKTAVLFAVTARVAAMLAGRPRAQQRAIAGYARCLGMAFQLMDDWLDYAGTATGKQSGQDLLEKKLTLPLIYALQHGNTDQINLIEQALLADQPHIHFAAVKRILEATQALDYTKKCATYYSQRAIGFLHQARLENTEIAMHLEQTALYVVMRRV